jgi:hypothetical protein
MRAKSRLSIRRSNATTPGRRAGDLRGALTAFAAFAAIFLQTFVVQTHVDFVGVQTPGAAIAQDVDSSLGPSRVEIRQAPTPGHDDKSPCPICQALAVAGFAVISATPALVTPRFVASADTDVGIAHVSVRPGHSWQSRAPPTRL